MRRTVQGARLATGELEGLRLIQDTFDLAEGLDSVGDPYQLLGELIRYIPVVVFCHDLTKDGKCLFVTKSFEKIWGLPCSALKKNPRAWSDLVISEDREYIEKSFHANSSVGEMQEIEYRIRDTSGKLRHIRSSFINLPNSRGKGTHSIGFASDITSLREAELYAYEIAHKDPLTGLANRLAFSETLSELIDQRSENLFGKEIPVIFFDIDRFGRINDALGHSAGDEYLRNIAERAQGLLGGQGILARVGGDEFALALTSRSEPNLIQGRLSALQQSLSQPVELDGEQVGTSVSMGIAHYPADGESADALIKAAELAMLRGKSQRRGSLTYYESGLMEQGARYRLRRDMALRHALDNEEFELVYQGQFQASSRKLAGTEVLLRWRHPEFGFVSPAEFIPKLEDSGDIIEVGKWVLRKACVQLAEWRRIGLGSDFTLAINISAQQLLAPGFTESVVAILNHSRVPPDNIELELTESAILSDPDRAEQVFGELRQAGVRLAIDDFGTGYSSIGYLRRFRPDTLKIDRSFISDCDIDETSMGIVESMIQLGKTLNMTIVAEGIESQGQADCLARANCDLLQGFLYSKPVSPFNFEKLLVLASELEPCAVSAASRH